MHLYIITVRRGFSKWKSEHVTRNKDNTMHKRKKDNNLQNTIQTHDRVTRNPLKQGMTSGTLEGRVVPVLLLPSVMLL